MVWHQVLRSLLFFLAWIFLLLVCIGSISDKPVIRNTYFLRLDLSHIIPLSVPNSLLINSIARSIGLHDFYHVGLWNFCEGYDNEGITHCSDTQALYWFNPLKILLSELLSGATSMYFYLYPRPIDAYTNHNPTVALPADITDALQIARVASHWMFGLFIVATVLTFILVFLSPLAVSSRPPQTISPDPSVNQSHPPHRRRTFVLLRSLPFTLLTFATALFTIVASVVATVMFSIFKNVFTNADQNLNIRAQLGTRMMAFMWLASAFNLIAFIIQLGSCCAACCGGRKARKQLKSHGGSVSNGSAASPMHEKEDGQP